VGESKNFDYLKRLGTESYLQSTVSSVTLCAAKYLLWCTALMIVRTLRAALMIGWSALERFALQLLYSVSCLLYSYTTYSILYSIGVRVKLKTFATKSYTISQMTKYLNSVNTFFLKPHMALLFCVVNI
jgi:hypothetical protein